MKDFTSRTVREIGHVVKAEIFSMLNEVKAMLCDGFYFSYGYDLTAS